MCAWRIGPDVGNVRDNFPSLMEPFEPEDGGDVEGQGDLFCDRYIKPILFAAATSLRKAHAPSPL
jgi:hypothetical protein